MQRSRRDKACGHLNKHVKSRHWEQQNNCCSHTQKKHLKKNTHKCALEILCWSSTDVNKVSTNSKAQLLTNKAARKQQITPTQARPRRDCTWKSKINNFRITTIKSYGNERFIKRNNLKNYAEDSRILVLGKTANFIQLYTARRMRGFDQVSSRRSADCCGLQKVNKTQGKTSETSA